MRSGSGGGGLATRVVERIAEPTYRVLRSLTEGATGEVHIVHHDIFGKDKVRKRVDLFGIDEAIALTEPRLLEDIRHENIVHVYEAAYDPAFPGTKPVCIYSDYYPERSVLTAFTERHRFSLLDAVKITRDMLNALAYVHEVRRYVVRDVKPSNVLLMNGRTKGLLTDFGEAAAIGADGTVAASGGSIIYHAPEWRTGRIGVTADIYAAGLVLFELANGPFEYGKYDSDEMERRIARGLRGVPDADLVPEPHVPDRLMRIVHKATHRNPAKRYQRADNFRAALMSSRIIGWHRTGGGWEGRDSGTRCVYRVTEEPRRSGVRLVAARRTTRDGPWRRFGVTDLQASADDRAAYAVFFERVLRQALQRQAT